MSINQTQARRGAPIGSDNARNRRDSVPAKPPTPLERAQRELSRELAYGKFVNWGGTASAPSLYGRTVSVDPAAPDPSRPFRANAGPRSSGYFASAAQARAACETDFHRENTARYLARLLN